MGTHFLIVCTVTAASVTALWPQAPLKCLCLGEPGMARSSSLDPASVRGSGAAGGALDAPPPSSSLVGFLAGATPTVAHPCGRHCCQVFVQVLWSCDHKVVEDLATVRAVQSQGAAGLLGTGQISVPASVSPVCVGSLFRGIWEEVKAVYSWLRPYLQT